MLSIDNPQSLPVRQPADVAGKIDNGRWPPVTCLCPLHLRKIDLADYIYVIDVGGYVGESTAKEIAYAAARGKPAERYSKPHEWNLRTRHRNPPLAVQA